MTDGEQQDESGWSSPRGPLNKAKTWVAVTGLLGVLKSAAKNSEFVDEPQILVKDERQRRSLILPNNWRSLIDLMTNARANLRQMSGKIGEC